MEVSLRLSVRAPLKDARSIYVSLKPDNEYPGPHLQIYDYIIEEGESGVYVLEVKCSSSSTCLRTVRGAVVEVLSLINILVKMDDLLG